MEIKRIDDIKTLIFLEPIPKWITTYGFAVLVIIALAIMGGSYLIKVPKTIEVEVVFQDSGINAILDFNQFSIIEGKSRIEIKTPTGKILGELQYARNQIEIDKVWVQVKVAATDLISFRYRNKMICKGEIIIENTTLFEKIFRRSI